MKKPRLLVFASGTAEGGGSGFEKLAHAAEEGLLGAEIVAVVSNHERGGVRARSERLAIPFIYFPGPWTAQAYQDIAVATGADFFALSGWLRLVTGLDGGTRFSSRTVFNIHPGPLPEFGGRGLYGHRVHEAVMAAYSRGELEHTEICMHFTTAEYDRGPVFFRCKVPICAEDNPDSLAARVNRQEHLHQARITDLVVRGLISWDGEDPASLILPPGYAVECSA